MRFCTAAIFVIWGFLVITCSAVDWNLYHTTDSILNEVSQLAQLYVRSPVNSAAHGLTRNERIAHTTNGSSTALPQISIGSRIGAEEAKGCLHLSVCCLIAPQLRVLLNFGEHGRELISSEVCLVLLRALLQQDDSALGYMVRSSVSVFCCSLC